MRLIQACCWMWQKKWWQMIHKRPRLSMPCLPQSSPVKLAFRYPGPPRPKSGKSGIWKIYPWRRTRSFKKVYLHKPMEAWWVSSMSVGEGSWCHCEAIQLSLDGHGERGRIMKSGRKQSHSYFWEWQEDRSGQPYLWPWEADGVNPPGKHSQTHKGREGDQE